MKVELRRSVSEPPPPEMTIVLTAGEAAELKTLLVCIPKGNSKYLLARNLLNWMDQATYEWRQRNG